MDHYCKEWTYEANISAKQKETKPQTRIFEKNVHQAGAADYQQQKGKGQKETCRLGNSGLNVLGGFTLSKEERLLKRAEFVRLSGRGKSFKTRHFIAAVADGNQDNNRIGITASKKVGNAVKRNRIKRIVREYFRHRKESLSGNRDINIIAKKGTASLPNYRINKELEELFDKIE